MNLLEPFVSLPDHLDQMQLFVSRAFLLYVLGYEYELTIDSEYLDYLQMVRDFDLGVLIPKINVYDRRYVSLSSSVMGCEIRVSFPMRTPLIELAETLLSVIEGFFSTCMLDKVMTMEPRLNIEITADDDDDISISHELDDTGSVLTMQVLCSSFTPDKLNRAGQEVIHNWLQKFVIEVFAHVLHSKDLDKTFEIMIGDDRALERSISFGACFNSRQNILGDNAVENVKAVLHDSKLSVYKLKRSEPWDNDCPRINNHDSLEWGGKTGDGEPPAELLDYEKLTHVDMQVQGLIKSRLWGRTVWCGIGFGFYKNGMPSLVLLFEDLSAATAIFKDLRKELGSRDDTNRLKVSIIRNINAKSPAHYRVCLSENLKNQDVKIRTMTARLNTMTPVNDHNISDFLATYEKMGRYVLSFATQKNGVILPPTARDDVGIILSQIHVIEAWKIGPNDIEVLAIRKSDDPVIPEGVENPPIFAARKRIWNDDIE